MENEIIISDVSLTYMGMIKDLNVLNVVSDMEIRKLGFRVLGVISSKLNYAQSPMYQKIIIIWLN